MESGGIVGDVVGCLEVWGMRRSILRSRCLSMLLIIVTQVYVVVLPKRQSGHDVDVAVRPDPPTTAGLRGIKNCHMIIPWTSHS